MRSGNPEDVVPQMIQHFGQGEVAAVALQEEVRLSFKRYRQTLLLCSLNFPVKLLLVRFYRRVSIKHDYLCLELDLFNQVTREELDVEASLHQSCSKLGVHLKKFWGSTLYHREDVPFNPQGLVVLNSFKSNQTLCCIFMYV